MEVEHLNIRIAGLADAALLTEFGRRTFYDFFSEQNKEEDMSLYLNEIFTIDNIRRELEDNASIFLIAEIGEKTAGYAKLRRSENPAEIKDLKAIEIQRIYADKEFVGRKVGKTLMEKCIEIARSQDCEVIWLGVWEHNQRAMGFYKNWGFEVFSSHIFVLGRDEQNDLLMKKKLKV